MKIKELIRHAEALKVSGLIRDMEVRGIADDSRDVAQGVLFVALRGPNQDGHQYITDAGKKGAVAIVLSDPVFLPVASNVPHVLVRDSRLALSRMADAFFDFPYQRIKCVGITGTNGKTTVSYLIRNILKSSGSKCGLIGTIGYRVDEENLPLSNTTPGIIELHRLIKEMVDTGNRTVVLEVSSHALDQGRVAGMVFSTALFTNLTQDHLDYHKSIEEYFYAKQKLFVEHVDSKAHLVINRDDAFGLRLLNSLRGKKISYGFSEGADIRVTDYELGKEGSSVRLKTPAGKLDISTKLVGRHNLYNIMSGVAFGVAEGIDPGVVKKGIESVAFIPGRLERIDAPGGFSVFVDYAHTGDALKNVLESLAAIAHNGRIITVFGCGGDRDKGKRPQMGRVATSLSDHCIITSDNPRSENPQEIIREIISGIEKKNFQIEEDRRKAIEKALWMAQKGDLVLIAGKGHESYQVIKDKILSFNDKEAVLKILNKPQDNVQP